MALQEKEQSKKNDDQQNSDEDDVLNELVEKARLQKKVLRKMMDQINKPKAKK